MAFQLIVFYAGEKGITHAIILPYKGKSLMRQCLRKGKIDSAKKVTGAKASDLIYWGISIFINRPTLVLARNCC